MTTETKRYSDIDEIISANRVAGHHFFDPSARRFFASRILPTVYAGRFFITSEQFVSYYPTYRKDARAYTIREADDQGHVHTVGEFQQYSSRRVAQRVAENLALIGATAVEQ